MLWHLEGHLVREHRLSMSVLNVELNMVFIAVSIGNVNSLFQQISFSLKIERNLNCIFSYLKNVDKF